MLYFNRFVVWVGCMKARKLHHDMLNYCSQHTTKDLVFCYTSTTNLTFTEKCQIWIFFFCNDFFTNCIIVRIYICIQKRTHTEMHMQECRVNWIAFVCCKYDKLTLKSSETKADLHSLFPFRSLCYARWNTQQHPAGITADWERSAVNSWSKGRIFEWKSLICA